MILTNPHDFHDPHDLMIRFFTHAVDDFHDTGGDQSLSQDPDVAQIMLKCRNPDGPQITSKSRNPDGPQVISKSRNPDGSQIISKSRKLEISKS